MDQESMDQESHFALLPPGFQDILYPEAAVEASAVETLMQLFSEFGYDRVKPPLVEFESSLLRGTAGTLTDQTFCLFDPLSHRSIALRSDITLQIARIASSRLVNTPRPLRLSYAGQVLRIQRDQLRPERQFGQLGCELIGSLSPHADIEIITLATTALSNMSIRDLSVDLCLPMMIQTLCQEYGLSQKQQQLVRKALQQRDPIALATAAPHDLTLLQKLMTLSGPAIPNLNQLLHFKFPSVIETEIQRLQEIVQQLILLTPHVKLTLDPIEIRNFNYHAGISFTFFAPTVRGELGRGGRYTVGEHINTTEHATGFTLYTDTLLQNLLQKKTKSRVLLPFQTPHTLANQLRRQGWVTVAALESLQDPQTEALRLRCSHVFDGTSIHAVDKKEPKIEPLD